MRVKLLAATMRALARDEQRTFLVSATRLGGRHGYDAEGATSVLGGAVTGFTKALAQERPDGARQGRRLRSSSDDRGPLAEALLEETLRDPGAVEVGHADELRWSVGLIEQPAEHDPTASPGATPCSS